MADNFIEVGENTSVAYPPGVSTTLSSGSILVGNGSNLATPVTMSGDVSIINTGATTIGGAAITSSKVATSAIVPSLLSSSGGPSWVINAPFSVNAQLIGMGTTTNDSAGAGYIGEYATSAITSFANSGADNVWADMVPITLSAGDWDVRLSSSLSLNGAIITAVSVGISSTSGNSATGLTEPTNLLQSAALPVGSVHQGVVIPSFRQSINSTTVLYAKLKVAITSGTPQYTCNLSARRMR